jgi:hypothetical protein
VRAGTSAIPKPESGLADEHTVVILRPAIGRTARAPARLSNRRSVSHARRGSPDDLRAPRGRAVLTDGRRPMFRSMRRASLRRAKSRRRSLQTSVHSHSRTSLRTRRYGAAIGHPPASNAGHDTIVDFDTKAGTRIAGTATRSDLHGPAAVETRSRLRRIPRGCAAIATAATIAALESKIVLIAATFMLSEHSTNFCG